MNPLVLGMADGTAYFAGLMLVLACAGLLLRVCSRPVRSALNILAVLGVALVVLSAAPVPAWGYLAWGLSVAASLVGANRAAPCSRMSTVAWAVLAIFTTVLFTVELPFRRVPRVPVPKGTIVYVVGDSVSAGMGTGERCWPEVLAGRGDLKVVNLSQPGATVESALQQARGVVEPGALVILEIGGNDLLGGASARGFREQLERLVYEVSRNGRRVLMLELPLFPFKNAFGSAQREVARERGVILVPKRCLTAVLGCQEGTLDGLHLSQAGHEALARTVGGILVPAPEEARR